MLDVAAGHGLYGIEIARALPGRGGDGRGLGGRSLRWRARMREPPRSTTGCARSPEAPSTREWGRGFDLVLLPNFLHHFDRDQCVALLRKVKASLAPAGRVLPSSSSPMRIGYRPRYRPRSPS